MSLYRASHPPPISARRKSRSTRSGRGSMPSPPRAIPNSGVIVGDDSVMVVDAQATPAMASEVIERVRKVTDKPIKYVLLHALSRGARARRLGLQGRGDYRLRRRARHDRRARPAGHGVRDRPLPAAVPRRRDHSRPDLADRHLPERHLGLPRPAREVRISHIGRAHTARRRGRRGAGRRRRVLRRPRRISSACYCGDAHFTDWPANARRRSPAFQADALVPGRGEALVGPDGGARGHGSSSAQFLRASTAVRRGVARGASLEELLRCGRSTAMRPRVRELADLRRCAVRRVARYDEAQGVDTPPRLDGERDRAMWASHCRGGRLVICGCDHCSLGLFLAGRAAGGRGGGHPPSVRPDQAGRRWAVSCGCHPA